MLLAFLPPSSPALAVQPAIAPGYWETRTDWLGQTGAPDRPCIKPQDVARFLSGRGNHIYRCTYPVSAAAGGAINFEGTGADKKGQLGEATERCDRVDKVQPHLTANVGV